MWKFHDFSITQILREINFEDFRSAKSAILANSEALNFDLLSIFALFECYILPKEQNSVAKTADFALLKSSKLISHKIKVIQKS